MKLMQLNAWGGRLEYMVEDLLKEQQPDILCLQEAISFSGSRSGLFITTENIQQNFDLPYDGFGPVFSFKYMEGLAKFGNGIFSRFPISQTSTVFTHMEHKENFMWGDDSANMRNFVHSVVDIDGKPCNVVTHHGFWIPDHKDGNPDTAAGVLMISDYVAKLKGPVILTGDFNLSPDSPSLKPLNDQLRNLSVEFGLKTTRTNLTFKKEVCDYIYTSKDVEVKSFTALDRVASDHMALILEFEL